MGLVALTIAAFLAITAPALALPAEFATNGPGAGQIEGQAQGIAVDQTSGDVYVADTFNARVDVFGPEGEFLLAFGWGVLDGSAELQVCTTATGCRAGITGSGAGQFQNPEGIAVDNSGGSSDEDIYVVDAGNSRIEKFGPAGNFILAFGEAGTGPGQFDGLRGRSIAVGPTGTIYVGDLNRVQQFGPAGSLEAETEIAGVGEINDLGVDSAGDIYVHAARRSSNFFGVHKYDGAGTELGTPRAGSEYQEGQAIAIGPNDELFLNDFRGGEFGHHLLTFDPAGEQLSVFDRGGFEQSARGIAYSEFTEALYVLNAGAVRIVTPPPPGPFVLPGSESATGVGTTSATLNATLNPEGPEATSCFFEYGTTNTYGETSPIPPAPLTGGEFEDQPFSSALAGLAPRTTYHYRVVCENAAVEVTEGPDQTFTTLPPVSIDATFAAEITATSATLGAELNPHGLPTTYHFEYDTVPYVEGEPAHGTATPTASAGGGEADVIRTAQLQGLAPLTTYHYRVVAENSLGVSESEDRTFTTQGPGSSLLPDARAYEMVTPPNKFGSPLEPITEEGGVIQAAADGSAFTEVALGPLGPGAKGVRSPSNSQWFSTRAPGGGWSTADITTPHEEISQINLGTPSEYKFFSSDLRSGLVEPEGITRLDPTNPANTERTPYRREADGSFVPLVNADNVPLGTQFGGEEAPGSGQWGNGVEFETATPDLSHLVLSSPALLTEEFEPGFNPNGLPNHYELTAGKLTLVSVLPDGHSTSEAGLAAAVGNVGERMRGAISDDGSRLFFETSGAGAHLYLRANATQPQSAITGTAVDGSQCTEPARACTIQLDAVQGGSGGSGAPAFQAASADGRRVFFTDDSRLTEDSTAEPFKPDLYMCEIELGPGPLACDLSDLSVDPNPGEAANVFGKMGGGEGGTVSAIDAAGTHVYFAANGVLTNTPNAHGESAIRGNCTPVSQQEQQEDFPCNLYVYDTGSHEISLVAVLSSHDYPDWGRGFGLGHLTARSSPEGRFFTFMSTRPLTGYDNRDATSGKPAAEVFLYDTQTGTLHCVSCNPSGARPDGFFDTPRSVFPGPLVDHPHNWEEQWVAASIPGWTQRSVALATYQSRYLADSGREFFNAADALVPADTNGVNDVYQYEPPGVGDCTTASPTYGAASGGCVGLISSGTSPEESAFLDASESGDDVFFLTASQLVRKDTDNALDVYDAAVGGGEPEEPAPVDCQGDACQQPATPPNDATPGSLTFQGAGNVLQCPKGKVKKSGHCVKKHKKAKKHHKKSKKHHAKVNRGAGK